MKRTRSYFGAQIVLILVSSLLVIWATALYDLQRNRTNLLHEAEVKTVVQTQVFAEYSRSTLKRLNEFILNARKEWNGDWQAFATYVKRYQENVDDLVFQVAIIDSDGILAFSNLAKPNNRTDLSEREHFRVHKTDPNADRLFISRPLKGKVSGKWSIQVTRPIHKNGQFSGVIVVSISPDQFSAFAEKMGIQAGDVMTVVRDTGEVMARYPRDDENIGFILKDRPFFGSTAAISGNYRQFSSIDNQERIWGFNRLPEYGMTFVMGQRVEDVLIPYDIHRNIVLAVASAVTLLAMVLLYLLYRSLVAQEQVRLQLAEIFALSPDGYVSFDARRRVSYISPAFLEMTGFTEDEIDHLDESAFSTRLAQRCSAHARFPGIATLRQRAQSDARADTDAGRQTHARQIIELSGAGQRIIEVGLRTSVAKTVSQILYFRDITHETEVDRIKSEFLSTAAHELRTPMASIYGFTELMLNQEFPPDDQREFLQTIFRQAELMVSIINELLDLSRIEARRGKDFNIEKVELGSLLDEIIAGFTPPAGRVKPSFPPPTTPVLARADRKKLTQAIGNVVSNAYKYSPAGGEIRIELISPTAADSEKNAGQVGIRITDQGIGMTQEEVTRVCERFYRADTSGKIPGTGLGMSIVKEIIELLGGHLEIESQPAHGTMVSLWIPDANSDQSA